MSLKCGILGLPNVGKSTLFNSMSSGKAEAANFPFCTIQPNIGIVNVPDKRLDTLSKLVNPKFRIIDPYSFLPEKDWKPIINHYYDSNDQK